ncbi:hypothetical protein IMSAGC016_01635 [Muribaculaceae bacterium]|nr:hypothetical protein IMSAGC016_01635 [Muribaculaceae bacterium]
MDCHVVLQCHRLGIVSYVSHLRLTHIRRDIECELAVHVGCYALAAADGQDSGADQRLGRCRVDNRAVIGARLCRNGKTADYQRHQD